MAVKMALSSLLLALCLSAGKGQRGLVERPGARGRLAPPAQAALAAP
jgi:hypothetical protein